MFICLSKGGIIIAGKTEYKNKWQQENRERINLVVPKGYKEIVRTMANKSGYSLNGYIKKAIDEKMDCDNRTNK